MPSNRLLASNSSSPPNVSSPDGSDLWGRAESDPAADPGRPTAAGLWSRSAGTTRRPPSRSPMRSSRKASSVRSSADPTRPRPRHTAATPHRATDDGVPLPCWPPGLWRQPPGPHCPPRQTTALPMACSPTGSSAFRRRLSFVRRRRRGMPASGSTLPEATERRPTTSAGGSTSDRRPRPAVTSKPG